MKYQVTCLCGHRFLIGQDALDQPVTCPVCQRRLMPQAATGGAEPSPAPAIALTGESEPTKRCPFCGEVILAVAKKCKHCGEFLDGAAHPPVAAGAAAPQASTAAATDAPPVFALSVSQWDNFWRFIITLCIAILVAAAFIFIPPIRQYARFAVPAVAVLAAILIWCFYLIARNSRCYVRPTRIDTEIGIFSKDLDSLELFRVTDLELKQNFLERILGIGTIRIFSNDATSPDLVLYQIPKARAVFTYLREHIPLAVQKRNAAYLT